MLNEDEQMQILTEQHQVKILLNNSPIESATLSTEFIDNFPKDIPFPDAQPLQNHLEALFSDNVQ